MTEYIHKKKHNQTFTGVKIFFFFNEGFMLFGDKKNFA